MAITKGTAVVIPPANAGVGDIIYCKSGADPQDASNLKVIGHGTVSNANNLTIDGNTYISYGVIYGFVNGYARVVAIKNEGGNAITNASGYNASSNPNGETNRKFVEGVSLTVSSSLYPKCAYDLASSTVSGSVNAMRNGKKAYYVSMNLNSIMQNSYTGANTIIHPNAAWGAAEVMSKANFDALTAGNGNAKDLYGTWENYLKQTLAVSNPGSCFMATDGDRKPHELGKWNTYLLGRYSTSNPDKNVSTQTGTGDFSQDGVYYPAAQYCYEYAVSGTGETSAKHNWWLPSMNELKDLMMDAHWKKVNTCGATTLGNRSGRWSSVRGSTVDFWDGYSDGFCDDDSVYYSFTARPVTLLKLV